MKNCAIKTVVLSLGLLVSAVGNAATVLYEDFEDNALDSRIHIETAGTFNSSPGIKAFTSLDGQRAFGFGRSTNRFNSYDNYATNIVIDFSQPTSVSSISFIEMEIFGNWGSAGHVLADGVLIGAFGRLPYNDGVSDTSYRSHIFDINNTINQIVLRVNDITDLSEIYLDNISVNAVPIPAALPLFGSALGLMGFVGWKRKKTALK